MVGGGGDGGLVQMRLVWLGYRVFYVWRSRCSSFADEFIGTVHLLIGDSPCHVSSGVGFTYISTVRLVCGPPLHRSDRLNGGFIVLLNALDIAPR